MFVNLYFASKTMLLTVKNECIRVTFSKFAAEDKKKINLHSLDKRKKETRESKLV